MSFIRLLQQVGLTIGVSTTWRILLKEFTLETHKVHIKQELKRLDLFINFIIEHKISEIILAI